MPHNIIKILYSLLFWTDHFMYLCQEYTKLGDLHPRVQERIKKLDPAEYSNMANPHNSSRYCTFTLYFEISIYCFHHQGWGLYIYNLWVIIKKRKGFVMTRPPFLILQGEWALETFSPHTRSSAYTRAKLVTRVWRKKKLEELLLFKN